MATAVTINNAGNTDSVAVTNHALATYGVSSSGGPGGAGQTATITRPANQTPYTALDVVGGVISFAGLAGASGGEVFITTVSLELDISAIPTGMTSFSIMLYSVTPPSAYADNAAWDLPSGDRASWLGTFNIGTPVDLGSTCYTVTTQINQQVTLTGSSLFAYLVTTSGYTPAANSEVYKVNLHVVGV